MFWFVAPCVQGMDHFGHTGPAVEQQLFSVDPSVVLVHQCLNLFQPIEAITGIGAIKPGDLFEGLVYSASLLIFTLLHSFSVFFPLFSFFFHSFPLFLLFLHLVTFLSCLSHCFCKANRIEESVLCADGLLVGGYCGKYGGGT